MSCTEHCKKELFVNDSYFFLKYEPFYSYQNAIKDKSI